MVLSTIAGLVSTIILKATGILQTNLFLSGVIIPQGYMEKELLAIILCLKGYERINLQDPFNQKDSLLENIH